MGRWLIDNNVLALTLSSHPSATPQQKSCKFANAAEDTFQYRFHGIYEAPGYLSWTEDWAVGLTM